MKKLIINNPTGIKGLTRIIGIMLMVLTFTACEKLLDEKPKTVAEEVFYNTAEEVQAAVNAIYSPIRNNMFANYVAALESHSDWIYGRGSWTPLGGEYQGLDDANITRVRGFWENFYLGIRNANLVILNAPNGSDISQEDIDRLVGEAKFLRAFHYFHLVRNWGAIPLRTAENMEEKDLPKSSEAEVYALIVSDLLDAESNLPDVAAVSGRPTTWAAKTLLADVYLELEQFGDAAMKAGEVVQSGKYSLVTVSSETSFQSNIFGPTIQSSSEEIFALKHARLEGQGNYILWISNHPSTGFYNFGGAYAVHGNAINPNYVNWDNGDIRKSLWDTINFGLGATTLVSSKYVDPEAVSNQGAGNDQPIYRLSDALLIYAEAAARSEGTVSAEAMEALNKVHRRAYGFNPASPSAVDFVAADYDVETFVDLVIKERGYEFQYEGKRWHELKRTGKANELIAYGKGKTIAPKHLLWPIPVSELNYNKALNPTTDQNPGY